MTLKSIIIIVTRGWHIFSITQVQNILFIEIKATQIILTMEKFYNTLILMALNVKEFFSSEVELLLNNKIWKKSLVHTVFFMKKYMNINNRPIQIWNNTHMICTLTKLAWMKNERWTFLAEGEKNKMYFNK